MSKLIVEEGKKMKTKISHFTWEKSFPLIVLDGVVKLEGSNLEKEVKSGDHIGTHNQHQKSHTWKLMKKQMKHTGRYVWFTEEDNVNCIGSVKQYHQKKIPISFYAEDIGAKKWDDVKKTIYNKQGQKIIKRNDSCAISMGDDTSKWWVIDTEVSLSKSIGHKS